LCNIGISYCDLKGHFEFFKKSFEAFEITRSNLSDSDIPPIPVEYLFPRTIAALLGAVMMASGGLLTESMALTRSMLENAAYAFYIHNNPVAGDIWLNRHKKDGKIKFRKYFKWVEIIPHIYPLKLRKEIGSQYDKCIDYGAHPNPYASGINVQAKNGKVVSNIINGNPKFIKTILSCLEKAILTVFEVYKSIYPDTYKKNNLDIRIQNLHGLYIRIGADTLSCMGRIPR
jgi:hypothetical protein